MEQQFQSLNPLAAAIGAACVELIGVLLAGLPMMGGMMNGYGRMGGPGYGAMMGGGFAALGVVWWLGGAVIAAFLGALFAWVYNAVNASLRRTHSSRPH